ncbi:MAG: heme exporter protein CcmD [Rhodospirillaceae bacterium]|nr:heme exporter protein CcmD [Rhodospirillaceae bacterium]|tara:strand:+ start:523 stop:774 length:252 start_codon:yes stop_codon:yes gene_type:complete
MGDASNFLAMGGYALYVWPAYAVAAIVMIALVITTYRAYRAREAELRAAEQSREDRRAARSRGTQMPEPPLTEPMNANSGHDT